MEYCICKILVRDNYDRKLSGRINLIVIWEKLVSLEGNLATFIWKD